MKESIIHIIKVITGQDYRELKAEWEAQNVTIDKLTLERNKKAKEVDRLINEKYENLASYEESEKEYLEKIADLKKDLYDYTKKATDEKEKLKEDLAVAKFKIKRLESDLKQKEKQRHTAASKIGGYVTEINKLKDTIEFLKKHRRAPSLDELKDYTLRRKSVCKKK